MCRCKVCRRNRFALRNIQRLGKNPCELIDEHGLSGCLFMNGVYDLWHENLPNFLRVLSRGVHEPVQG